jgi:hypothetical protein
MLGICSGAGTDRERGSGRSKVGHIRTSQDIHECCASGDVVRPKHPAAVGGVVWPAATPPSHPDDPVAQNRKSYNGEALPLVHHDAVVGSHVRSEALSWEGASVSTSTARVLEEGPGKEGGVHTGAPRLSSGRRPHELGVEELRAHRQIWVK